VCLCVCLWERERKRERERESECVVSVHRSILSAKRQHVRRHRGMRWGDTMKLLWQKSHASPDDKCHKRGSSLAICTQSRAGRGAPHIFVKRITTITNLVSLTLPPTHSHSSDSITLALVRGFYYGFYDFFLETLRETLCHITAVLIHFLSFPLVTCSYFCQ
jgi:hypothetical protein